MDSRDLDIAVALATGESLHVIESRGFTLADLDEVNFDPEPDIREPDVIDWDVIDLSR